MDKRESLCNNTALDADAFDDLKTIKAIKVTN